MSEPDYSWHHEPELVMSGTPRSLGLPSRASGMRPGPLPSTKPAEPELSVVCFRHLPDGRDGADEAG